HLGLWRDFAERPVFDQLFIHASRPVHGRKERDVAPQPEPLAGEKAIGNLKLASEHFLVVFDFGIFFEKLFIFPEGALILMLGLIAAPQKILRLRSVVREPPDLDGAPRGFE